MVPSKEAVTQRCSYEKVFWKYAVNLQENIHAEVGFKKNWTTASASNLFRDFCSVKQYHQLGIQMEH